MQKGDRLLGHVTINKRVFVFVGLPCSHTLINMGN